ncbi:TPA: glycosyltransferase family 4 protein [Enterococcus faecium]|uniref:glycosyltransferase family 4 protein n=1 Tax=Enterococcus faecium TaxID=1352 RepID=UPI0002A335A9|nr:glycosyltransferase family 4 protein [Enterococcus faecium]ELB18977.1 hypothetical protein OIQ_03961 [Enterococcus faecium EnGen0025]MBO6335874.1 glycosyltransferase [Enterococcus faecium]RYJ84272.1 glycosyltransferase [Enterococcus faecium]
MKYNREKDVLIYLYEKNLAPCGGPNGVGYYLYEENKKNLLSRIEFIKDDVKQESESKMIRWIFKFFTLFICPKNDKHISNKYRIIHFHSTLQMYMSRKSLKKYNGKVVLMSHSPVPLAFERFEAIKHRMPSWIKTPRLILRMLQKADKYAFEEADYIVFPCEYAMEPYITWWPEFATIISRKKDNLRYITTGINSRVVEKTKEEVCKELNIPENSFICCFVGRHNEVKGYDQLKVMGKELLDKNKNMYFLVCGNEFPIKGLEHERWIEVGFTKDPYSYISASDVFILPNKETYFDLVAIEVLSLGKIMVGSRTGGNKYYEQMKLNGVKLFDNIEEAVNLIQQISQMPKEKIKLLEDGNKTFYYEHLRAAQMYKQTEQLYESILKNTR